MSSKIYGLGVDPGLANLGLSVVSYDPDEDYYNAFRKEESVDLQTTTADALGKRLATIASQIESFVSTYGIQCITCEGFAARAPSKPYSMGAAHGITCFIAHALDVPIFKISPSDVKKFAALKHNGSKEQVRKGLCKAFGFNFPAETKSDSVDATAMAMIGLTKCLNLTKHIKERARLEATINCVFYQNFNTKS